jgi:hypothetical protein
LLKKSLDAPLEKAEDDHHPGPPQPNIGQLILNIIMRCARDQSAQITDELFIAFSVVLSTATAESRPANNLSFANLIYRSQDSVIDSTSDTSCLRPQQIAVGYDNFFKRLCAIANHDITQIVNEAKLA